MNVVFKETKTTEIIGVVDSMETTAQSKQGLLQWIKEHKKQLLLTGISITVLLGVVIGIKKKDELEELWQLLSSKISQPNVKECSAYQVITESSHSVPEYKNYTPPKEPFNRCWHIRNMAPGKHHSAEKAAEAAAHGIHHLEPNKTFVKATIVNPPMKNAA